MLIREVMTSTPSTCYATDSANAAARIMWERDCGSVPVVDESGRPVGIVTDRDLCMASYFTGRRLSDISLGEVMTNDVCVVSADTELAEAERLMQERQVRRLPVVDDGCLVGIVSLADVALGVSGNGNGNGRGRSAQSSGDRQELLKTVQKISEPRRGGDYAPH